MHTIILVMRWILGLIVSLQLLTEWFFFCFWYYWTVGLGWLMAFRISKGSLHCNWKRGKCACIFPTAFLAVNCEELRTIGRQGESNRIRDNLKHTSWKQSIKTIRESCHVLHSMLTAAKTLLHVNALRLSRSIKVFNAIQKFVQAINAVTMLVVTES